MSNLCRVPRGAARFRIITLLISALKTPGRYIIELDGPGTASREFDIGAYPAYHEDLLFFMRQQRCGYNPFLDMVCHRLDGRSFYAPFPDETFVDASGGWHDAGDQLKYLITASNATARMILAYELEKSKFDDFTDAMGRENRPNGMPDILDEAKWGLDWTHKLHPTAGQLFHQVADDRDHRGFKMPDNDNADYGWGANSYRPVYFADGKPQGLSQFKSRSTGVANNAGRSAAAMAMAYRVWQADLKDPDFAAKCLKAAETLYQMGKRQEGFQQGNSFGAPYRYNEDTWADDMEWAAAELYKATRRQAYLADAKRYAKIAGTISWMEFEDSSMGPEMSRHYQMYPFTNVGHFALYPLVDAKTKRELAGYYRSGIERIIERAKDNPYGVAVPAWRVLIWESVNAYYVVVDAETGTMLWRKNIVEDQTQAATYNVYRNASAYIDVADSPAPLTPGPLDPNLGTQGALISRVNLSLIGNEGTNSFNNLGWINDGQNQPDGNSNEAGIDRDGINGVDPDLVFGNPNRVFTSTWNPPPGNPSPGDNPLTEQAQRGAVIQMFYVMNRYHDELYKRGFTEAARNFQHDNFGRGGLGNDRVSSEGQDSSGVNNANFATPADGGRGRMQMYL